MAAAWFASFAANFVANLASDYLPPYINKFFGSDERPLLEGLEFLPSKDFRFSESSKLAFSAIIDALTTDDVHRIGLYGMPGVGKTTLAKIVGHYVTKRKLFDKVVMVTMSQTPNINNIQDRIAEILGLEFKARTEEGRAGELWRKLEHEKILIIIDDVWDKFELKTVGIPNDNETKHCEVLLTTRQQEVCNKMDCQKDFKLEILTKDDAWDLFKIYAGLGDLSPTNTKFEVAKEIARKCQGLPLAIKVVANALKNEEDLEEWETANQRLKDSRHSDNLSIVDEIYVNCIRLSYDHLKSENIKSCFLLCSLFPEDYDIPINLLVLIGIGGDELFRNVELMETQRKEIRLLLKDLQRCGLLLEINEEKGTVRMHDVVRDFAHWLTTTGDRKFMVKDKFTKWSSSENYESLTVIAIWNLNMDYFPDEIEFKNLRTLILRGGGGFWFTIPVTFFRGMKKLRVLWLENVKFSLEALQFLTNLRALLLVRCALINKNIWSLIDTEKLEISSLIDTEKLEIFYVDTYLESLLHGYSISEELGRLRHLKYLYFGTAIKFSSMLLSRLTSLQELHILDRNNINLWELSSLSCLSALSLRISLDDNDQCLEEGFVFPKLQRYSIAINNAPTKMKGQRIRILKISNFSSSFSPFKKLFSNMEKLILSHVSGVKYIVPNEVAAEPKELTSLDLHICNDLEYLIESTENHANAITSLQSLKDVQVRDCKKIKFIFPHCVAHTLFHLQQLNIECCDELEQVFVFAEDDVQIIEEHQNLHHLHGNAITSLQSLKVVNVQKCRKLKSIFSACVAHNLLHLQELSIGYCNELEQVFQFAKNHGQIVEEDENLHHLHGNAITSLQSLKAVKVWRCRKLKSIFSACVAHNLLHLQVLSIDYCDELEQVFQFAENHGQIVEENEGNQLRVLSNLTNLSLAILPKLRCIWSVTTSRINLSSLKALKIYHCDKLEFLFSSSHAQTLMNLEYINIRHCKSLEHLISTEVENEDACCWPKFRTLEIYNCESLKDVFSITLAQGRLPALKKIEIIGCPQLTGLFIVPKESDKLPASLQILKSQSFTNFTSFSPEDYFEILPSLTELQIDNINYNLHYFAEKHRGIWLDQFHLKDDKLYKFERVICKAHHVKLHKVIYDKNLVPNLNKLTSLIIEGGTGLECLIDTMDVHDQELLLSNSRELEQSSLPELKCIWKGPIHNDSLSSLKVVKISKCNRLKYVMSASLAQNLVQLQQLLIADCVRLEHIISESENDIKIGSQCGQELRPFLPNLQDLHLKDLMNLSGFSSKNSPITLPLLNKLAIESCPRLVNIRIQKKVNEHVGLKELKFSTTAEFWNYVEIYNAKFNMNQPKQNSKKEDYATILEIFDAELLSKVEFIELDRILDLRGPIHVASLQYLSKLRVWNCDGLKSLFSPMLARNLPQLTSLEIKECKVLEEIIDTTSSSSAQVDIEARLPHRYFPNLERVHIFECNNLKSLFPVSVIPSLSKINTIKINKASKLEQVFKYEAEVDINQDDQNHKRKILLPPCLTRFELEEVPALRSLAPMGYHFLFPDGCSICIRGYSNSKFLTSFSRDSEKVVHAITQAQSPKELHNDVEGDDDTKITCIRSGNLPPYKEEEECEVVDV